MPPVQSEGVETPKESLQDPSFDTKSYHHVLIASCDTRETYPNYGDLMDSFINAVRVQERAPSYLVFLPTESGPRCDYMVTTAKMVLARRGVRHFFVFYFNERLYAMLTSFFFV